MFMISQAFFRQYFSLLFSCSLHSSFLLWLSLYRYEFRYVFNFSSYERECQILWYAHTLIVILFLSFLLQTHKTVHSIYWHVDKLICVLMVFQWDDQ